MSHACAVVSTVFLLVSGALGCAGSSNEPEPVAAPETESTSGGGVEDEESSSPTDEPAEPVTTTTDLAANEPVDSEPIEAQSPAASDPVDVAAPIEIGHACSPRCARIGARCAYHHQPFADCHRTPGRLCPSARGMIRDCDPSCCGEPAAE